MITKQSQSFIETIKQYCFLFYSLSPSTYCYTATSHTKKLMFSKLNNWLSAYLKTLTWWCNFQLPVGEHSAWQPCRARGLQLQVLALLPRSQHSQPQWALPAPSAPLPACSVNWASKQPRKPSCTRGRGGGQKPQIFGPGPGLPTG